MLNLNQHVKYLRFHISKNRAGEDLQYGKGREGGLLDRALWLRDSEEEEEAEEVIKGLNNPLLD